MPLHLKIFTAAALVETPANLLKTFCAYRELCRMAAGVLEN
jgi:hypothetical protein